METKMRFNNKIVMVTGAGGDIGRAISLKLAAEGASEAVANMSRDNAEETVRQIARAGGKALVVLGDIGNANDVERCMKDVLAGFGGLDILVNNAGISPLGSILDTSLELWDRTVSTNLSGIFYAMKYALPLILARGGGSIVNIAGTLGLHAMPRKAAYCAAKAGAVNLTRQAAIDYGPQGVRINCICPGYIETRLNAQLTQHDKDMFLKKLPLRHGGVADDVANAVAYLASAEARYVTGSIFTVDGGQTAGIHD
jgi:NAD(P)-dependent dehydrogenase (short-subunit alcohol dehydrogenase family)